MYQNLSYDRLMLNFNLIILKYYYYIFIIIYIQLKNGWVTNGRNEHDIFQDALS